MFDTADLRMPFQALQQRCLEHLISGLDENDMPPPSGEAAIPCQLSGYTEWVSQEQPALTIGWDWELLAGLDKIALRRVGQPRSNICLSVQPGGDCDWPQSDALLSRFVDGYNWQDETLLNIQSRYQA